MHPWNNFNADVTAAIEALDLNRPVPLSDSSATDSYVTANELGLTARFVGNVGIQLNTAYMLLDNGLRFGDIHAVSHPSHLFPDVSIISIENEGGQARAVGELKTPWSVPLQAMDLCSIQGINVPRLEQHIGLFSRLYQCVANFCLGQLVSYMRLYGLKYGWLSTYYATIFVRRVDAFRFELSPPILFSATSPSVRQCFLGFGCMIGNDYAFTEQSDFNPSLVF